MMVYVGSFAYSLGPIVWLLISEIFPLQARGIGHEYLHARQLGREPRRLALLPYDGAGAWGVGNLCDLCRAVHRDASSWCARGVPETKREILEDISLRGPERARAAEGLP